MMNDQEVMAAVIAAISEIQVSSGRPLEEITDSTRPTQDLKGFDSLSAVEAITIVSQTLGREIFPDLALFVEGTRPRTVGEISEAVSKFLEESSPKNKRSQRP
jgi:acyl carrier protein